MPSAFPQKEEGIILKIKNSWNHHPDWNFQELYLAVRFREGRPPSLVFRWAMAHSHATLLRCYLPPLARFPRIVHDNGAQQVFGAVSGVMFLLDEIPENTFPCQKMGIWFLLPWVLQIISMGPKSAVLKNIVWNHVVAQLQRMSGMSHDVSCMYTTRWLPKRQCICSISFIVDASTHPDSICVFSKHTILFIFYSKTHIPKMSLWKQSSVISI